MSRKTEVPTAGNGVRMAIRETIRAMAAIISRARRIISRAGKATTSFEATTVVSSSTTARINPTVSRPTTTARCGRHHHHRNYRPMTCRSRAGPTPCARPSNRSAVTIRMLRGEAITTSIGKITVSAPMTVAGQAAPTDMATAGAPARNIAPVM
ncbi:hypothetical protein D3C87_1625160 [compost metagenome]